MFFSQNYGYNEIASQGGGLRPMEFPTPSHQCLTLDRPRKRNNNNNSNKDDERMWLKCLPSWEITRPNATDLRQMWQLWFHLSFSFCIFQYFFSVRPGWDRRRRFFTADILRKFEAMASFAQRFGRCSLKNFFLPTDFVSSVWQREAFFVVK